ncbi:MAG: replication initiation protein [Proteobacteria bacterium]|jgi:plasmid replication initiation protein|nr:replication initiation protein [Pseudomonadota bacterium]
MTEKPKVLKSKTKKVYKSNKLNKANFANFNLNDYRVYLNAIALIGGVTAQGKYVQPNEVPREYRLSAIEFSNQFNIDIKNSYRILKQATDKLMNTNVKIEKPELFQTWKINVCERAVYNEKEGTIDIMFTGSIMEYLKQRTKNFTLYNLKEVADLTSIYAVRLYELMQQFNTTTGMLIHTIEQWREMLGIQPTQYKLYGHLKDKVFNQALEEINEKTGYQITMTEIKEGRKVVRIRFDFTPDKILSGVDLRSGEMVTRHRKPRKPKINKEIKTTSEAHPDQQELEI